MDKHCLTTPRRTTEVTGPSGAVSHCGIVCAGVAVRSTLIPSCAPVTAYFPHFRGPLLTYSGCPTGFWGLKLVLVAPVEG